MNDCLAGPDDDLPLRELRVIELHAIGPVPFAGQLLRALGATLTRVSPPGDPGLGLAMQAEHDLLNAGKSTVVLDLKQAEGLEALHALLAGSDVLLEGFRPGVLERLGLGPAALLARHPRLVIGRLSGWGSRGALAPRAGHDINYLAMAGVLEAIGPADAPVAPLNLVADFGGGAMHLLAGVLARLVRRGLSVRPRVAHWWHEPFPAARGGRRRA
jgi:alpha-methylacyl-CoA racemase